MRRRRVIRAEDVCEPGPAPALDPCLLGAPWTMDLHRTEGIFGDFAARGITIESVTGAQTVAFEPALVSAGRMHAEARDFSVTLHTDNSVSSRASIDGTMDGEATSTGTVLRTSGMRSSLRMQSFLRVGASWMRSPIPGTAVPLFPTEPTEFRFRCCPHELEIHLDAQHRTWFYTR